MPDDVENGGFETCDLAPWNATGAAFDNQPVQRGTGRQRHVPPSPVPLAGDYWHGGYHIAEPPPRGVVGDRWISTDDAATGTLTSPPVTVSASRPWFSCLVGGAHDLRRVRVELLVVATEANRFGGRREEGAPMSSRVETVSGVEHFVVFEAGGEDDEHLRRRGRHLGDRGEAQPRGTGLGGALTFEPPILTFPPQPVGSFERLDLTLRNTSNVALHITSIQVVGDFIYRGDCGPVIAPNGACWFPVVCQPKVWGVVMGTFTVVDGTGAEYVVHMSGRGTAPRVELDTTEIAFDDQPVGTTGPPRAITATNAGDGMLVMKEPTLAGRDAADFELTVSGGRAVGAPRRQPSARCPLGPFEHRSPSGSAPVRPRRPRQPTCDPAHRHSHLTR